MKYKSAMTTQASGSVDGMTASHNRFGRYLRSRAIPVNPATTRQSVVRQAFTSLALLWRSLTAAQRQGWEDYAANTPVLDVLGDAITLTGLNWYIRTNVPRMQADLVLIPGGGIGTPLGVIDDAPATPGLASLGDAMAPQANVGDQDIDVTFDPAATWAANAGGILLVFTSRALSVGVNFFKGPWRLEGAIEGSATPLVPPLAVPYSGAFGFSGWAPFAVGDRLFVRFQAQTADGRTSSPFSMAVSTIVP